MNYYGDDDLGERMDADLEMAALNRAANAASHARRRGICQHGSAVGYRAEVLYPEQVGLKPGETRCTEGTGGCNRIFASDRAWLDAMREARGG